MGEEPLDARPSGEGAEGEDVISQVEKLLDWVDKEIAKINADERYHYKPALVQINAPLALEQTAMSAQMAVLVKVKSILEES